MRPSLLAPTRTTAVLTRGLVLAALWWLLVQGDARAWLVGAPVVALAAFASLRLAPPSALRLSLSGLARFSGLFLVESIRGGLDVACRTLAPRLRVRPGFARYRVRLQNPGARVLLANCISLLPGTLAVRLHGDVAELHLLDVSVDPTGELQRLEQAVAEVFDLPPGGCWR